MSEIHLFQTAGYELIALYQLKIQVRLLLCTKRNPLLKELHSTMVSILASGPSCPGFNSQRSLKVIGKKLSMLQRLINRVAYRKVNSGLKIWIEAICYWQVAS